MNGPFQVRLPPDKFWHRPVLFALELRDAVTLERVWKGVTVKAHGLQGKPVVNQSGLFVWLQEDITRLQKISIDPGALPFESVEIRADKLQQPLHVVELPPRVDYSFDAGVTGLRGTLIEERMQSKPVKDAQVTLRWLDEDDDWHTTPTYSHTTAKGGDFVAILRLAKGDFPKLEQGKLTTRLYVKRGSNERHSPELELIQGRVAYPLPPTRPTFAWDELQP